MVNSTNKNSALSKPNPEEIGLFRYVQSLYDPASNSFEFSKGYDYIGLNFTIRNACWATYQLATRTIDETLINECKITCQRIINYWYSDAIRLHKTFKDHPREKETIDQCI